MCQCIGLNQSKIDNQILQAKKLMSLSTSHQIGCPEARLFQVCASMFASCVHNFINTLKLVMFSLLDFGDFSVLWSNVCKTYVFPIGRSSEDVSLLFCLCSCPFGLSLCEGKRSVFSAKHPCLMFDCLACEDFQNIWSHGFIQHSCDPLGKTDMDFN